MVRSGAIVALQEIVQTTDSVCQGTWTRQYQRVEGCSNETTSYCFVYLWPLHCWYRDGQVWRWVAVAEGAGSLMAARILALCLVCCGLWVWCAAVTTGADAVIAVHQVEGIINPVVVEYMTDSIRRAEEARAVAVIFQLDTPGGLVDSTREIVKALLNANVPTVLYVAPSGARAASAGTFITMAAHIAAMAPGTNIGAAHPVSGEGKDIEGDMRQKAENDLAAFARSIAEKRQRNVEWAEKAVRESVAVTESEARAQRVVDVIAEDIPDLVQQLNGRQVTLVRETVTLHTAGCDSAGAADDLAPASPRRTIAPADRAYVAQSGVYRPVSRAV